MGDELRFNAPVFLIVLFKKAEPVLVNLSLFHFTVPEEKITLLGFQWQ